MHIYYPDNLPVVARKNDISETISAHQVVIIAGDTGSGKTTQIPKICLETFTDLTLRIGCTQPRRIAASSVSGRVRDELGDFGDIVGYKIRFHDHTSKSTRIKFMTDGVLLAETRNDPLLKEYGVIVLDEAHERSLNIDFLLGYIRKILPMRPDLKIIVTSATIDTQAFAAHFDNAPVISVSGRTYPVTTRYSPLVDEDTTENENYVEHCAAEIIKLYKNDPAGDILAFLPTEKDIRSCCTLVAAKADNAAVLPMFGRLQAADQKRIFQHHSKVKIVIATNVAETSITVPGIRYVVDSGLARMSFYNSRAKTTSLPIHSISRASCDQRKGRCGRIGPGVCVRLYSEEDYQGRDEFTLPEIKRANLAEVILQMTSLKLGRPEDFPFLEPPHRSTIRDGYKLLNELGAITPANSLTPAGKFMAALPIDPCISRILLEAKKENCLKEVKIIASALAIQDPRIRPAEREKEADAIHKEYAHPHSDFMALLNVWNHFHEVQGKTRSWSKLKKYCKAHYLSFQRMREWLDLHEQLGRVLKRLDTFQENSGDADYQQIHRALASGFLRNIAIKKQGKIYQGAGNRELMIFPGSHQFLTGGQWIMAASFLETNRLYGLTVATIEPDWLENLAPHLIRYNYSNPRWSKKSGKVVADERASIFGLTLISARVVDYGRRSPKNRNEARDIFIQSALVEANLQGRFEFLSENIKRLEKWRKAEDKLRTTSIVKDDSAIFEFYDSSIPAHVYGHTSLIKYLKKNGHAALCMSDDDILIKKPDEHLLSDFPPYLQAGSIQLSLKYDFSPGSETDGLTVRIPLSHGAALPPNLFEWLVPGLLREKITILIKGLPKSLRKHLVPVNITVDRLLDEMVLYQGSLHNNLENIIFKLFRISIQRSDWPANLPSHLQTRFILFALDGKEVASGRNLPELLKTIERQHTLPHEEITLDATRQVELDTWQKFTTRTWDFADLPENLPLHTPQGDVAGFLYPVLIPIPDKGCVGIEFIEDKSAALSKNIQGVQYLYRLQFGEGYKRLKKYCKSLLSGPSAVFFTESGIGSTGAVDQMLGFIMREIFPSIDGTIPSQEIYTNSILGIQKKGFYRQGQEIGDATMSAIRKRSEIGKTLQHYIGLDSRKLVFSEQKILEFRSLMAEILPPDFLTTFRAYDLKSSLRQLQSLVVRIERFYNNPRKDQEKMKILKPHIESLDQLKNHGEDLGDEARELLLRYEILINEFRISLFSPEIRTILPVSEKKLARHRQELLAKC